MKHLLSITDFTKNDIEQVLNLALVMKKELKEKGENEKFLMGKLW